MKKFIVLILLLSSCKKEKTECFCRKQIYKIGTYTSVDPNDELNGMQTITFQGYSPYYREDCNKGGKWYLLDSTKKCYLICE